MVGGINDCYEQRKVVPLRNDNEARLLPSSCTSIECLPGACLPACPPVLCCARLGACVHACTRTHRERGRVAQQRHPAMLNRGGQATDCLCAQGFARLPCWRGSAVNTSVFLGVCHLYSVEEPSNGSQKSPHGGGGRPWDPKTKKFGGGTCPARILGSTHREGVGRKKGGV